MPAKTIGFNPVTETGKHFHCLWSLSPAWGEFTLDKNRAQIDINSGSIELCRVELGKAHGFTRVAVDGKDIGFTEENGGANFDTVRVFNKIVIEM